MTFDRGAVLGRIRRLWVAVGAAPDMDPARFRAVIDGAQRPTSLDLALIAEAGGVTVDWLLSGRRPRLAAGSPWDLLRDGGTDTTEETP